MQSDKLIFERENLLRDLTSVPYHRRKAEDEKVGLIERELESRGVLPQDYHPVEDDIRW